MRELFQKPLVIFGHPLVIICIYPANFIASIDQFYLVQGVMAIWNIAAFFVDTL